MITCKLAINVAMCVHVDEQIQKVVVALGDYMNAECHACIGGTAVREDLHRLSNGVHIVVGTPGRVYDMINRRALSVCRAIVISFITSRVRHS